VGYRRKVYVLRYDGGTPYEGLEVRLRGLAVDGLMCLAGLADLAGSTGAPADLERMAPIWDALAAGLVAWNLEDDDGAPVPVADFRGEDFAMLLSIAMEWMQAAVGVSGPKGPRSNGGSPFPEESLPMEVSSPDL
jgi:hypothetical protein